MRSECWYWQRWSVLHLKSNLTESIHSDDTYCWRSVLTLYWRPAPRATTFAFSAAAEAQANKEPQRPSCPTLPQFRLYFRFQVPDPLLLLRPGSVWVLCLTSLLPAYRCWQPLGLALFWPGDLGYLSTLLRWPHCWHACAQLAVPPQCRRGLARCLCWCRRLIFRLKAN